MTALSTGTVSAVARLAVRLRSSVSGAIFTALMDAIVLTVSALRRCPACTPLSWYSVMGRPHLGMMSIPSTSELLQLGTLVAFNPLRDWEEHVLFFNKRVFFYFAKNSEIWKLVFLISKVMNVFFHCIIILFIILFPGLWKWVQERAFTVFHDKILVLV